MESLKQNNDGGEKTIDFQNELIPELKAINDGQAKKIGSWTLLLVTVFIFFSAGIVSVNLVEIVILIMVLFIHELGHMITMKLLKYNDVKMFFIPLIGAAVSGKSKNESALKSCIVSALGPFPGIILGILLFILFGLTKNYYILKTAEIMILLNAFNLLPIMPLDGGRYVDVLFVNNRYFRFVFALMGAAVFLLLGFSANDFIVAFIGIVLIFGSYTNLKINSISHALKQEGIAPASFESLFSNPNDLENIVTRLQAKFPRLFKPKINYKAIYTQISEIINTLKFTPARLWAKISLIIAYTVLLIFSILVTFTFVGMHYNEKIRKETVNGQETIFLEKHFFGSRKAEYRINEANYYNGEGVSFFNDSDKVEDIFYYENGYREGEWLRYNINGDIVERARYEKGRLVQKTVIKDGQRVIYTPDNLPILDKIYETIIVMSQPYKSNHEHFD